MGDAIGIKEINEEVYLYILEENAEHQYRGKAYSSCKNSRHVRIHWKELSMYIINKDGRAQEAHYRVGEPLEINGTRYLPIITRKNYAAKDQL